MIVTTTPTIEGHPIREYKGLVTGETIIGANFVKDFFAVPDASESIASICSLLPSRVCSR